MYSVDEFLRIDELEVVGKTVLLRVDINSRVDGGKLHMTEKIARHAETIVHLSERGAKTVVISHQGRPGDDRFITMEQHAELLRRFVNVTYVDDVIGPAARDAISGMWDGEVLLLENVRILSEETLARSPDEHASSIFVRKLSPLCDIYINDAFETAHRAHASLVGFPMVMPSGIGLVTEEELGSLTKFVEMEMRGRCVYMLGGGKLGDVLPFIKNQISSKSSIILTAGRVANAFLSAEKGVESDVEDEYVRLAGDILRMKNAEKIKLPDDVALNVDGERVEVPVDELSRFGNAVRIYDIGGRTCDEYISILRSADAILIKGPAGVYENEMFAEGTKKIFGAVANMNTFSLIGGGDTTTALNAVGIEKSAFSYVSLAGGALLKFLSGERLPALDVLILSKKKWQNKL
ncbi:phosphoglycerate kinase [Methanosarcinales archaeon]|nr:MAG: phosphoglycerate kinase [Methanosarcinales archaeon]